MARTLDVPEQQVLIRYAQDENGLFYHHRLLLVPGGAGRWIVATPTFSVQSVDLAEERQVIPLPRAGPFPAAYSAQVFGFDEDIDAGELARIRNEAAMLARVMGFSVPAQTPSAATAAAETKWRIADTAYDGFGEVVPNDLLAGGQEEVVLKDEIGLLLIDEKWVVIELVEEGKLDTWRSSKLAGPACDQRLIGDYKAGPRRFIEFKDAVAKMVDVDHAWTPFDGPSAAPEYLEALVRANLSFSSHHRDWSRKSGVGERSGVCREHRSLCEGLDLAVSVDQFNLKASLKMECDIRRLISIETAVKRNPKQPDFDGLDVIMAQTVDESGSLLPRKFNAWLASRKKDDANVMKQYRLWQEEQATLNKKSGKPPPDGGK